MPKTSNLTLVGLLIVTFLVGLEITKFEYQVTQELEVPDLKLCSLEVIACGVYEPVQLAPRGVVGEARITKYGWTGYTMANGEYPYPGAVAASDRQIPLGTKVKIDGAEYVVKDRTALWVHEKHGLTFDIFSTEPRVDMMQFGAPRKKVVILYDQDL